MIESGPHGIVLFGDVVASRTMSRATDWLRALRDELDEAFGRERLAAFEFTQGDELQGLLAPSADPLEAVVRASLRADRLPMRWVVVAGAVDEGTGPATQRSGPAFLAARELVTTARRRRDSLTMRTGDPETDDLLDGVAPVLGRLLDELTDRQREVARLLLVERLTQSAAAARLGVRPPTVSVAAERARVREIAGLRAATLKIFRIGLERVIAR
jgi:DNA-binding CsgD family transcriptional regulator